MKKKIKVFRGSNETEIEEKIEEWNNQNPEVKIESASSAYSNSFNCLFITVVYSVYSGLLS